jgi:hypothetical protein
VRALQREICKGIYGVYEQAEGARGETWSKDGWRLERALRAFDSSGV